VDAEGRLSLVPQACHQYALGALRHHRLWLPAGEARRRDAPTKPPRQLRELTRHRTTLVQDRARVVNRLQTVLEDANIKLASVVTDIRGVSARAMLEALIAGERDVAALAELARERLGYQVSLQPKVA
jgi:transposase